LEIIESSIKSKLMNIFVALNSNVVHQYSFDLKNKEQEQPKLMKILGELETHKQAIRNIQISQNDRLLVTTSFDSVKVWQVDFSA